MFLYDVIDDLMLFT